MSPSNFSLIGDTMSCQEERAGERGGCSVGVAEGRSERKSGETSQGGALEVMNVSPLSSSPPLLPLELGSGNPAGEENTCPGKLENCGPGLEKIGGTFWGGP